MASLRERLQKAVTELPAELQSWAQTVISADEFGGVLSASQADEGRQRLGTPSAPAALVELMQALLPLAAAYAHPPVSGFPVGAWLEGESGALYVGANQEFPGLALSHSVHAEQAAVSHAWQSGELAVRHLAVTASPCGHCRQFLNELDCRSQLLVSLPQQPEIALAALLPDAFGPDNLGIAQGLLATRAEEPLWVASDDALVRLAAEQAALSYAPYSRAQCAVALELEDGRRLFGRYAENAAFNPSLPPMQAALWSWRRLQSPSDIKRAVLVERAGSMISLQQQSQQVLASEWRLDLEHWLAEDA